MRNYFLTSLIYIVFLLLLLTLAFTKIFYVENDEGWTNIKVEESRGSLDLDIQPNALFKFTSHKTPEINSIISYRYNGKKVVRRFVSEENSIVKVEEEGVSSDGIMFNPRVGNNSVEYYFEDSIFYGKIELQNEILVARAANLEGKIALEVIPKSIEILVAKRIIQQNNYFPTLFPAALSGIVIFFFFFLTPDFLVERIFIKLKFYNTLSWIYIIFLSIIFLLILALIQRNEGLSEVDQYLYRMTVFNSVFFDAAIKLGFSEHTSKFFNSIMLLIGWVASIITLVDKFYIRKKDKNTEAEEPSSPYLDWMKKQ